MSGTHSEIGASSAHRWVPCPGSVRELRKYKDSEAGPDARLGTAAHDLLHKVLSPFSKVKPEDYIHRAFAITEDGTVMWDTGDEFIDESSCKAVAFAATYFWNLIETEVKPYCKEHGCDFEVMLERTVSIPGDDRLFGSADILVVVPMHRLWVIDYKNGVRHAVKAEGNHQLAFYGLAGATEFLCPEASSIILQPRIEFSDRVSRMELDRHELDRWEAVFLSAAKATRDPSAPLVANRDKQCVFCKAKLECPAYLSNTAEEIDAMFDDHTNTMTLPAIEGLTPVRLSRILNGAKSLRKWLKAVEELEEALVVANTPPPGWQIVEGKKGDRKWKNTADVEGRLELLGVPAYEKKLITPAALEKMNPEAYKEVADSVVKSPGSKKLARTNDAGESIDSMFVVQD